MIIINVCLFLCVTALTFLYYLVSSHFDFIHIDFSKNGDITSTIITLSLISIATFQIIIDRVNDRILGMSLKKLLFKDTIWKFFNFPNCTFILFETIFSIVLNFFPNIISIPHYSILAITIIYSFWLYYLSIIATIKKL